MTTQIRIYKGRFPNQKPTEAQVALMRKMGILEEIIKNCDRYSAFLFIKEYTQRHYNSVFEHKFGATGRYLRW